MKTTVTSLMQGMRMPEGPLKRRLRAQATGLYLLELRAHSAQSELPPKHKLIITLDPKNFDSGRPKPIKISVL